MTRLEIVAFPQHVATISRLDLDSISMASIYAWHEAWLGLPIPVRSRHQISGSTMFDRATFTSSNPFDMFLTRTPQLVVHLIIQLNQMDVV